MKAYKIHENKIQIKTDTEKVTQCIGFCLNDTLSKTKTIN